MDTEKGVAGMPKAQNGPSKLITFDIPDKTLQEDLKYFRQKALEFGASMAEIIPADWVEIDERVRLKCAIPLCPYYNKSIHCPPHTPSIELMRKAVERYRHAILFALDVIPPECFSDRTKKQEAEKWSKKAFEIVGRLETLAFGKGYYFAVGYGQASCKKALCRQETCLVLEGGKCPYPLKARPSMEAVGMDVFGLVTKVGWEIYPIYRSVNADEVPRALSVGIVFIH
jgi:predicted metal-binding protein